MSRIIIHNRTEFNWSDIMFFVDKVINQGKLSDNNTCYAYATTFKFSDHDGRIGTLAVFCGKTKTGYRFDICWEV